MRGMVTHSAAVNPASSASPSPSRKWRCMVKISPASSSPFRRRGPHNPLASGQGSPRRGRTGGPTLDQGPDAARLGRERSSCPSGGGHRYAKGDPGFTAARPEGCGAQGARGGNPCPFSTLRSSVRAESTFFLTSDASAGYVPGSSATSNRVSSLRSRLDRPAASWKLPGSTTHS